MAYSLLNVSSVNADNTVNGVWIQDSIGTLEKATQLAKETSKLNYNIDIAVVTQVNGSIGRKFWNLTKLN